MAVKTQKPFSVRDMKGSFIKGYNTLEEAEASAKERNARAEEMGIEARYQASDQPSPAE